MRIDLPHEPDALSTYQVSVKPRVRNSDMERYRISRCRQMQLGNETTPAVYNFQAK